MEEVELRVQGSRGRGIVAVAGADDQITDDALNEDDNALDHRLHHILALVLKGDALDMLTNQDSGKGLACWQELVVVHEPRSAGHQRP